MMTGAGGGAGSDSHTLYYVDTAMLRQSLKVLNRHSG